VCINSCQTYTGSSTFTGQSGRSLSYDSLGTGRIRVLRKECSGFPESAADVFDLFVSLLAALDQAAETFTGVLVDGRDDLDRPACCSCQDAREGGFVASRDRARSLTGAGLSGPALLVVMVRSRAVRAWIGRCVAAGLIRE
jgi:hypothetical protein